MTKLQEAYERWVSLRPFRARMPAHLVEYDRDGEPRSFLEPAHFDGTCCFDRHHHEVLDGNMMRLVPKPDDRICPRERAWREYVRIRDGAGGGMVQ